MKKFLIGILVVILLSCISYFGYRIFKYYDAKKSIETAIVNDDLKKAEINTKKAMNYSLFNKEKDKLILNAINKYREAKNEYLEENFDKAKKMLSDIDEKKLELESLSSNIEALKLKIDKAIEDQNLANSKIEEINSIFEAGDYNLASSKIKSIYTVRLTEEQKNIVNELDEKVKNELERIKREEEERLEALKQEEEAKKIAENKQRESEVIESQKQEEERLREEKYGKSKYSREEAKDIFIKKSKFESPRYKVEIIDSKDYNFNGDLCYFIRATDTKNKKKTKREYYFNSYTGDYTLAKNIKP